MVEQCTCKKCGNVWTPKKEHPKCCPRCKRYDWDKEPKPSEVSVKEVPSAQGLNFSQPPS